MLDASEVKVANKRSLGTRTWTTVQSGVGRGGLEEWMETEEHWRNGWRQRRTGGMYGGRGGLEEWMGDEGETKKLSQW